MGLDWSTFVLEIVNFLVLVWILKRFLYRPVLAVLAERRSRVEQVLAEARAAEERAGALKNQFESRLADWEQEKTAARERLAAELALERERHLESLAQALNEERERSAAQDAHRQEILRRELVAEAGTEARQFASRLLGRVAGPELEARLVDLFIEELAALPEERLSALRAGQHGQGQGVFATAYPLPDAERRRLTSAIEARLRMRGQFDFVQDGSLLAGVRLTLGAWQLDFSLAGELGVYAEIGSLVR
jgi:F-type H+-transporting ATPase subunit b